MRDQSVTTVQETWSITYTHATGPIAGAFLTGIRAGKLMGRHCPVCNRVLVPPREFCDRDYVSTDRWEDVALSGTLETFTVVYQEFQGLPKPPYAIGYVLLDGADTAILNYLRGVPLSPDGDIPPPFSVRQRLRAVFAPASERLGRVTDFWFEPDGA